MKKFLAKILIMTLLITSCISTFYIVNASYYCSNCRRNVLIEQVSGKCGYYCQECGAKYRDTPHKWSSSAGWTNLDSGNWGSDSKGKHGKLCCCRSRYQYSEYHTYASNGICTVCGAVGTPTLIEVPTPPNEEEPEEPAVQVHYHTYAAATCTKPATCTTCSATSGTALGHNYKDATCTNSRICKVCGATEGSPVGHNYVEATCTTPATCIVCGVTNGTALGHNYSLSTCTNPSTCTRCGVVSGNALGHSFVSTGDALYTWSECTRCGEINGNKVARTNTGVNITIKITNISSLDISSATAKIYLKSSSDISYAATPISSITNLANIKQVTINLKRGTYNIKVIASDKYGNVSQKEKTIMVGI